MENELEQIKTRLLITGNQFDDVLTALIQDTKNYLLSAGILPEIIDSDAAIGCISRGVFDLFNNNATFSEIFRQRVIQLQIIQEA